MKQSIPKISIEGLKAWLRKNLFLVAPFSGVIGGFILGFGLGPLELEKDTILLLAYPGELFSASSSSSSCPSASPVSSPALPASMPS